jgi:hypothetical protein
MKVKIKPELDDEAFKVGDFIQELGKIQEEYLDKLVAKDYDKAGFEDTFSENVVKYSNHEVE